jgi:hypothetical protein
MCPRRIIQFDVEDIAVKMGGNMFDAAEDDPLDCVGEAFFAIAAARRLEKADVVNGERRVPLQLIDKCIGHIRLRAGLRPPDARLHRYAPSLLFPQLARGRLRSQITRTYAVIYGPEFRTHRKPMSVIAGLEKGLCRRFPQSGLRSRFAFLARLTPQIGSSPDRRRG